MELNNLKIISAGAGSGKTYRLTNEMVQLLHPDSGKNIRGNGIIATTFTKKAAAELQERVRQKLLEEGLTKEADDLTNALIGTVHSLGVKLLKRFAFEAGVSPEVDIIADEDQQIFFNLALAAVLTNERITEMEALSRRMGLSLDGKDDWRSIVKNITDAARSNDFSAEVLDKSKILSFKTFQQFLPSVSGISGKELNNGLKNLVVKTIEQLTKNEDNTSKTHGVINRLKDISNRLFVRGELEWKEWVFLSKLIEKKKIGKKSEEDILDLVEYAKRVESHPDLHEDVKSFIYNLFDISKDAIAEYNLFKKTRGLIDYIDMEIQVNHLMNNKSVQAVLREELDLLMVDEFQDTSPIQLEIFLKLSQFAKYSIWVGDPKQSIYGFRGAEPKLMQAIIEKTGGIRPEDIQSNSWRSRQDLVHTVNAIFTKAFNHMPVEQVALEPPPPRTKDKEPLELSNALLHWHFQYEGKGKRLPGKPWMENAIATQIRETLQSDLKIVEKDFKTIRSIRPGDIAVLCRTNKECEDVAGALHREGLKVAISRSGLLKTAESKLILACLNYILNKNDSLSVAEILLLAAEKDVEVIIENRLSYLERLREKEKDVIWANETPIILRLNQLRPQVSELSSTEILNLVMEELDLRRIIAGWTNPQQRFDNVDTLRKYAIQYEDACNRLHDAASLGGFLLWLNELANQDDDRQGSGVSEEAVNVLTYHRSKGLEWNMVICHNLERGLQDKVFGLSMIAESEEVDLNHILKNRWLRYWINPFEKQLQGTPFKERIEQSADKKEATANALQEEARLLYVGITRARDYLVLPSRKAPTKWLNRTWHQGDENTPTLVADSYESPWVWNDKVIPIDTVVKLLPATFDYVEPVLKDGLYFEERAGVQEHDGQFFDFTMETLPGLKVKADRAKTYGPVPVSEPGSQAYLVAKTLKTALTGDNPALEDAIRYQQVEQTLGRFGAELILESGPVLKWVNDWQTYLQKQFSFITIYKKYPFSYKYSGRYYENIIDFVGLHEGGIVLIQHSGFPGGSKKWRQKAQELGPVLHLMKESAAIHFQSHLKNSNTKIQTFVHFVLGSGLMEIKTEEILIST